MFSIGRMRPNVQNDLRPLDGITKAEWPASLKEGFSLVACKQGLSRAKLFVCETVADIAELQADTLDTLSWYQMPRAAALHLRND